jgi:spore maturation protein CgeB
MNVLYIGQLFEGSTALHRFQSIEKIAKKVIPIDSYFKYNNYFIIRLLEKSLKSVLNNKFDWLRLNKKILSKFKMENFDFVWIDKGLVIKPETLEELKSLNPQIKIIHYSPDDMMNPILFTKRFLHCIPLYDYYITTKSYNVEEVKSLGGLKIIFVNNAFDPSTHKKIILNNKDDSDYINNVSFVGTYEKDRFEKMLYLAESGVKVTIWGGDRKWKEHINTNKNLDIRNKWVWGDEYTKVINGSKINLNFLKKEFRDLQTQRSVEIPAAGGFMLAERTIEHQKLFKENIEAEYFSTNIELLKKINYYLLNDNERNTISNNGYTKCIRNYSNDMMIKKVFKTILENG